MEKNNYLRYSLTLFTICFFASALLAFVFNLTKPQIEANMLQEEESSLSEVCPQASTFKAVQYDDSDEINYYIALDENNSLVGYVFKAKGRGYASVIETMVGIDRKGEILNIKVISQKETPGLGSRVQEVKEGDARPWFQSQFSGKNVDSVDDIVTITGATVSSKAVISSIQEKAREVLELAGAKD